MMAPSTHQNSLDLKKRLLFHWNPPVKLPAHAGNCGSCPCCFLLSFRAESGTFCHPGHGFTFLLLFAGAQGRRHMTPNQTIQLVVSFEANAWVHSAALPLAPIASGLASRQVAARLRSEPRVLRLFPEVFACVCVCVCVDVCVWGCVCVCVWMRLCGCVC